MTQTPTVGRIVHYQSFGTPGGEYKPEARAAVVTRVHSDTYVDLCVLNPGGIFFNTSVQFDADGKPGTWRWPPRQ